MTTEQQILDPSRTVVLIMDFQNGIVNTAAQDPQGVVDRASLVLRAARQASIPVIYIVHRGGRFEEASPDAEIHSGVAPAPGERVISKTKAGSFSTTGLDILLREMGRDTLVLMGVATSGCVLSTSRWATDINYRVIVIKDACDDRDPEVHKVLTEKIFSRQGVLTADEFPAALSKA